MKYSEMFKCITRQESLAAGETILKKVTVVGDGHTGKTSLINRFSYGQYAEDKTLPTMTNTLCVENIQYGNKPVELKLHDTAGQEDYGTLRPISYPGTDVVVVCFAIDNPMSLENVSLNWIPEIRNYCGSVPIILVGTKSDLRKSNSKSLKYKDGLAMAYTINATTYLECSSKLDNGVEEVFHEAVKASVCKQKKKRLF